MMAFYQLGCFCGIFALLVLSCGREGVIRLDLNSKASSSTPDGSNIPDPDAGLGNRDASALQGDLWVPSSQPDAQEPHDSGDGNFPDANPVVDTGPSPVQDAQVPPADASPPIDSGVPPPDAGVMPECMSDQDCSRNNNRQLCEPTLQVCVECHQNSHCPGRVCDTTIGNVCRTRCVPPSQWCWGQVCDPSQDLCVDCLSHSDCDAGEVCDVMNRSCVECLSNADCASNTAAPLCLVSDNICIECLSDSDCSSPDTCDASSHECGLPNNRPLCEPCTDDAQCGGPNDLCINSARPACGQDCSNTPCPRGYECIDERNSTVRQCRPDYEMRNPSCEAIRNMGNNCNYSRSNPDPGCGIQGLQDARCVQDTSNPAGGVCVVWCQTNDHCPARFSCVQQTVTNFGYCL